MPRAADGGEVVVERLQLDMADLNIQFTQSSALPLADAPVRSAAPDSARGPGERDSESTCSYIGQGYSLPE